MQKMYPSGNLGDCLAIYDDRKQVFKKGRINIDFADTGVGKTTLEIKKNICFACGQPFYDLIPRRQIHCLYFNTEQTYSEINRRYISSFCELYPQDSQHGKAAKNNLEIYDMSEIQTSNSMSKKTKTEAIIKEVETKVDTFRTEHNVDDKTLMMLTIDPAYKWWADCLGTNNYVVRYVINPLQELSERKNLAITLVCHTQRVDEGKRLTLNNIQGGHNLPSGVDSIFAIEALNGNEKPQRTIHCLKGEAQGMDSTFTYNEEKFLGDFKMGKSTYDCYSLRTMPRTKSSELRSLLKNLFPNKARTKDEIDAVMKDLKDRGVIKRIPGKNEYHGCQFEKKPDEIITDVDQLNDLEPLI